MQQRGAAIAVNPGVAQTGGKLVKMAPKLAFRNLFHDKLSLFVTLIGIVFSVLLVAIQSGLYLGAQRTIAVVIDEVGRRGADLWVVPIGTKSFDDASLLKGREKFAVLATPGAEKVEELLVTFSFWRKPDGGQKAFVLVGSDATTGGLAPWNVIEGDVAELGAPGAVAIDKSYFPDLGVTRLNQIAEIAGNRVRVAAVTQRIRAFTTLPYIFTTTSRARNIIGARGDQASYVIAKFLPGTNIEAARKEIQTRLGEDVEVLTHAEFRLRSINYWLFKTGAGMALISGMVLGVIVGVVIVAQTLYASTKDHLNEFATLRALGAPASYIITVILIQAFLSALIGYAFGMAMSLGAIQLSKYSTLNIVMTPELAAIMLCLTIVMCAIAAVSAIFKVTRIDPAGVFSR
jgi:putative ABC transport system permease protein